MTDVREIVSLSSRILGNAKQGDLVWGHASARDADGRGVWIKENGCGFEEVTPERVLLVDPDGNVLEGRGRRHSEYPIHTEIMAARPDVGGVVHTHSPHAVALSATGQPLRPVSHAANLFVPPGLPTFTLTTDLILTRELGRALAAKLGESLGVFLLNHGIVTVGNDLEDATVAAILLERACQQQMLTHGFGGWPTWTTPEESMAKREHIYPPEHLRQVWDYLVRQLAS